MAKFVTVLPDDWLRSLQAEAARRDLSTGALVRKLVAAEFRRRGIKHTEPRRPGRPKSEEANAHS